MAAESFPTERAEEISERLAAVETATNEDGTVQATVLSVEERADGEITIFVKTAMGTELAKSWPAPETWTRDEPFVRAVETMGGSPGALERLVGAKIDIEITDDGYQIPGTKRYRDMVKSAFAKSTVGWVVVYYAFAVVAMVGLNSASPEMQLTVLDSTVIAFMDLMMFVGVPWMLAAGLAPTGAGY